MNSKQKNILLFAIVIIVGMMLYPPFSISIRGTEINMGYGLLFDPPKRNALSASVNTPVLLIQFVAVFFVGIISWFIAKDITSSKLTIIRDHKNKSFSENVTFIFLQFLRVVSLFVALWQVIGLSPVLTWFGNLSAVNMEMAVLVLIKISALIIFGLLFFGINRFINWLHIRWYGIPYPSKTKKNEKKQLSNKNGSMNRKKKETLKSTKNSRQYKKIENVENSTKPEDIENNLYKGFEEEFFYFVKDELLNFQINKILALVRKNLNDAEIAKIFMDKRLMNLKKQKSEWSENDIRNIRENFELDSETPCVINSRYEADNSSENYLDDLNYPLNKEEYKKKYRISETKLNTAISLGRIKSKFISGALYVEDSSP